MKKQLMLWLTHIWTRARFIYLIIISTILVSCEDVAIEPAPPTVGNGGTPLIPAPPCPDNEPYQYLILNKTESYKSIEFQTRKFVGENLPGCFRFTKDYAYTLRQNDFAYITDSVFFNLDDHNSSSPVYIIDSLGNRLFEAVEGNGTYEIRYGADNKPELVKVSDQMVDFDCDNVCSKYVRPFDVTVTNHRSTDISVIADVFFYRCGTADNDGVGTCFPSPLADLNAEVFTLTQDEFRNFQHMADQIIISFGNRIIDLDPRKNPDLTGNVRVDFFDSGVEIQLDQ